MRAGEIVGVYGLLGAGRTELFETLLGLHQDARGEIQLSGRRIDALDVAARVREGIAMVPEDRQRDGLIQNFSVQDNMTLSSLGALGTAGASPLSRSRPRQNAWRRSSGSKRRL